MRALSDGCVRRAEAEWCWRIEDRARRDSLERGGNCPPKWRRVSNVDLNRASKGVRRERTGWCADWRKNCWITGEEGQAST